MKEREIRLPFYTRPFLGIAVGLCLITSGVVMILAGAVAPISFLFIPKMTIKA